MTKKLFNSIKNMPMNAILLVIALIMIGYAILFIFYTENHPFEYVFTLVNIAFSAIVVACAITQNKIQKNNIKIQMFDKRYAIFQVVLDSLTIIKRDNWDRYLLFKGNDVNKQIIQIEENLYKSVQLSICLFDKDLHLKLISINNAFCKVTKAYKEMLVANVKIQNSQEDIQAFGRLFSPYLLNQGGLNSKEFEQGLKDKFPDTYESIMIFSDECNAYISFVEKSGVIKDFEKYIIVNKLEL